MIEVEAQEVVNFTARLELSCLLFKEVKVFEKVLLDLLLDALVGIRVLHDDAEAWSGVRDEPVDELLQVRVQVDGLDLFDGRLHVE